MLNQVMPQLIEMILKGFSVQINFNEEARKYSVIFYKATHFDEFEVLKRTKGFICGASDESFTVAWQKAIAESLESTERNG